MKLEYDQEANAAYAYLKFPVKKGEAKKTIPVNDNIIIDLDEKGRLLGVEILNARRLLPKQVLMKAVLA
ncbi:MAG: DUF2283 domain-containing protein [Candidatus Woesearchaeota archaeon]|nr:DUF2283 domain-containing protein [Candidatus Woesearchaeota archaeon]MDP7181519.1 DUF2283 domain-containing protein [Candidatus Woesearchaeota archaeon]MDP7198561.1 DUF2283 domain-containing protein [Candidatus Woesearchaeota archaeon]MDP7466697.1 DUF2283 domain-containing protein [Candidatus Woesearchaeota archaeon]MDP7647200.1 DUF2283 domain-containing protein [Candidatus Woesearchaeota archaeon]